MKKFLSLILAVLMIVSAVSLVACDFDTALDIGDVAADTAAATETTTDTTASGSGSGNGTTPPASGNGTITESDLSNGQEVSALGTKTPYQLYLDAASQLSSATQFQLYGYEMEGGNKSEMTMKLSANSAYPSKGYNGNVREAWFVDGVTYETDGTIKRKYTSSTFEEDVKPFLLDNLRVYYISDIAESKFENVKLMKTATNIYFFTVSFTADDKDIPLVGAPFDYVLAFNADGEICQMEFILADKPDTKIVFAFDLGETPAITAPADAASYTDVGTGSESRPEPDNGGTETGSPDAQPGKTH